jgi:hypothetical protein
MREDVLEPEVERPPGEVDRLERTSLDPGRMLEQRAQLAREWHANLLLEPCNLGLRQRRRELEHDLVAVLVDELCRLRALDRLDRIRCPSFPRRRLAATVAIDPGKQQRRRGRRRR